MPRGPRVFIPGVPSHVVIRGNDRQDIVHCDGDRLRLLAELREVASEHQLAIHAYVLMTNHLHAMVTGERDESLPRAVQALGRRYVAYFNRRYSRTGTLWEGRYKSAVIASDQYSLHCHRYIEQNPVRAGMVERGLDYPWSSCRRYASGQGDDLVTPYATWMALATTEDERQEVYQRTYLRALDEATLQDIRSRTQKGFAIGLRDDCLAMERRFGCRLVERKRGWVKGRPREPIKESDPFIAPGRLLPE